MKCPTCGKSNDDRALFCDNCGAALSAKTATEPRPPEQWIEPKPSEKNVNTWAIVAAVVGACLVLGVIMVAVLGAVLMPVFSQAREKARTTSCQSNLKQLSLAMLMYVQDYDEKYPPKGVWSGGTMPYVKNYMVYLCSKGHLLSPTVYLGTPPPPTPTHYGFNSALPGLTLQKIISPASTIALFETKGPNEGGASDVAQPGRHQGGNNFGFVDGHVRWFKDGSPSQMGMSWSPSTKPSGLLYDGRMPETSLPR